LPNASTLIKIISRSKYGTKEQQEYVAVQYGEYCAKNQLIGNMRSNNSIVSSGKYDDSTVTCTAKKTKTALKSTYFSAARIEDHDSALNIICLNIHGHHFPIPVTRI